MDSGADLFLMEHFLDVMVIDHMRLKALVREWKKNGRLRLTILPPNMQVDPHKLSHTDMHHVAFEFDDLDHLLDPYVRLSEQGIAPHAGLDHGMTLSFYYVDPDGNSVELQADNFGDWAASSEFVRTSPDFARDPIGTPAPWHGTRSEEP